MHYRDLSVFEWRLVWVYLFFLLGLAFVEASASEEYRNYTGRNGNAIRAKIMELKPNMVEMRLDNGSYFKVPYSEFSKEDQEYLRDKFKKENEVIYNKSSRVEITFHNGLTSKHEGSTYDRQTMKPRITFTNKDHKQYTGVNGTLVMLGKSTSINNDRLKIFIKEKFSLDLPAGKDIVYHFKQAHSERYAGGRRYNYRYGYKYYTYVLIIKNRRGEVVYSRVPKSIPVENVLKVKQGNVYDRKLE